MGACTIVALYGIREGVVNVGGMRYNGGTVSSMAVIIPFFLHMAWVAKAYEIRQVVGLFAGFKV